MASSIAKISYYDEHVDLVIREESVTKRIQKMAIFSSLGQLTFFESVVVSSLSEFKEKKKAHAEKQKKVLKEIFTILLESSIEESKSMFEGKVVDIINNYHLLHFIRGLILNFEPGEEELPEELFEILALLSRIQQVQGYMASLEAKLIPALCLVCKFTTNAETQHLTLKTIRNLAISTELLGHNQQIVSTLCQIIKRDDDNATSLALNALLLLTDQGEQNRLYLCGHSQLVVLLTDKLLDKFGKATFALDILSRLLDSKPNVLILGRSKTLIQNIVSLLRSPLSQECPAAVSNVLLF